MSIPLYAPAPPWTPPRSRYIDLYHGCTTDDKKSIDKGIDLTMCRIDTDFGRGFYTTTVKYQAEQWAWTRSKNPAVSRIPANQPVVLKFHVDRHQLADLKFISFVLADPSKDDFWSFVQHCRKSRPGAIHDHRGPVVFPADGTMWYDVACGPVSAFWRQKFAMQDTDQFSFHTCQGVGLLNNLIRSGKRSLCSSKSLP